MKMKFVGMVSYCRDENEAKAERESAEYTCQDERGQAEQTICTDAS